ncbi:Hypothetical predicted protein [Olea europaea subsp. europaea]|uniref:Uncharacterized protein n=1 Tax=Olea europaea subsp. europaea TaxID=158383 RepID=A0A8S0PH92_OLEEU|nr:Hypothetical predicted protein [Olea europaea subsp. europaea]
MLMRKSISEFNSSTSLPINNPHHDFRPLSKPNSSANLAFKSHKKCKPSVQCLNNTNLVARNDKIKRNWIVRSSVEPGPPTPSGPPSNPLNWILGIVIAVLIPFIGQKWGPIKNKIETVLNKAEDVAEGVEKMAEKVEKVAEDISDDLPAGGQLRRAVDFVEKVAERAAKDAGLVDDFIDEIQEKEEKVESYVESLEEKDKEEKDKEKEKEPAQNAEESETKNI